MGVRQGCSPGFWGRGHHLDRWPATYHPSDKFNQVFGLPALSPTVTLFDSLNPSRPVTKLSQLARQATAALLNAAHPSISYPLTTNQVITKFQEAYHSGQFEKTKDEFEVYNELFCPL